MKEPANLTEKNSFIKIANPIRSAVFFVLFFLYLWLKVDLRIIAHCGGIIENFPVFYLDWAFFLDHLSYPGKPLEYLVSFLAQLWYIGWLGALIATITAWLIFACTDTIIKFINAPRIRFLRFAGPILLLAIYSKYTYHFDTAVSSLISLSCVVLYLKITQKQKRYRAIAFLALGAVLYYLGGKSYLLFAMTCGIHELFFNRRVKTALMYLLLAIVVLCAVEAVFLNIGAYDTFLRQLTINSFEPIRMQNAAYLLYFMLPLIILAAGLLRTIGLQLCPVKSRTSLQSTATLPEISKTIVLIAIAVLSVCFTNDHSIGTLKADYYASRKNWPKVIRTARSYPTSRFTLHLVNRALYHTARLSYDLFSFPQDSSILYLTTKEGESTQSIVRSWQGIETCLDLGDINRAQRNLWNALELYQEQPALLKNLALVNMVKGNYNSARVHLTSLTKTLFHAKWANGYIDKLNYDPTLQKDAEIQRLRRLMPKQNYGYFDEFDPVSISLDLLNANDQNRMAFEYMMAFYLLERAPGLVPFLKNLHRLKEFNYTKLPRLYEEAILVYMYETKKKVDLHGFLLSAESVKRNNDFAGAIQARGGLQASRQYLSEYFGDSYLFYYLYGKSGAGK